ncbi:hypothetical protein C7S16_5060 [Burkholderia thailandensis]|uniref:Uncharacterized protein n=1 Tax=Burkholderia thailandensis TaxID=57975 RepID=A0AAW9CU24_BURTH|nr:hypothetical protein [Burkholderia thailandensis]MDW9252543.1 hypothetical protein [Burkholderia thailandensis]
METWRLGRRCLCGIYCQCLTSAFDITCRFYRMQLSILFLPEAY